LFAAFEADAARREELQQVIFLARKKGALTPADLKYLALTALLTASLWIPTSSLS
jgi:hypothetical protein